MKTVVAASAAGLVLAAFGASGQVVSLYGDEDAFGAPIQPAEASGLTWRGDHGATFFADYRDAGDLANAPATDNWDGPGGAQWTHTFIAPGTITSVNLHIYIVGDHDIGSGSLFADGVFIATLDFPGQFEHTHSLDFAIPTGLATDGVVVINFDTVGGDGWALDYAELTVVPAPAAAGLLGLGALAIGRRRR